jgi:hypothetical protein
MNLRLTILLVVVLIIAGGAFLVVRLTSSPPPSPKEPWLYRIDEATLVSIEVKHQGQTVSFNRYPGSTQWLIQEDPEVPVFMQRWSGVPLLLSGPRVNRVLLETIDNPEAYGLEPPAATVTVWNRVGNSYEFHLGNPTPNEENQYVRLVGSSALYTVPLPWGQVITRLATEPPYLRLYQLEHDDIVFFQVTSEDQTASYGKLEDDGEWYIVDEGEVPVSQENWEEVPLIMAGPRANEVISENLENPENYGLEPPQTTVLVGLSGGEVSEFHLGGTTPDGKHRYARVAGEPKLYAMLEAQAQRIIALAIEPPYPPDLQEGTPGPG